MRLHACARVFAWLAAAAGLSPAQGGMTAGPPAASSHARLAFLGAPPTAPIGGILAYQLVAEPAPATFFLELSATGTTPGIVLPAPSMLHVPLNPPLLVATFGALSPTSFQNFTGTTDALGQATATLAVPPLAPLIGLTISAAFVVVDPSAPFGVAAVSNAAITSLTAATALTIGAIIPPVAAFGQVVTVVGTGFTPGLFASVSGAPIAPMAITPTSFTFRMIAGAYCDAPIVVALPDGQSAFKQFSPSPAIIGVTGPPGSPCGGTPLTVSGLDFHPGTTLTIGGAAATILTMTTTMIDALAPPGASGPAPLVVTSVQGCPATTVYVYL